MRRASSSGSGGGGGGDGSLSEHPGGSKMSFKKTDEGLRKGGPVYCLNPTIVNRYLPPRETVGNVSGFKPTVAAPNRHHLEHLTPPGEQTALRVKDFGAGLGALPEVTPRTAAPSARVQRAKVRLKRRPATAGSTRRNEAEPLCHGGTEQLLMELTPRGESPERPGRSEGEVSTEAAVQRAVVRAGGRASIGD